MKKLAVILALSLAGNLALLAMFFIRPRVQIDASAPTRTVTENHAIQPEVAQLGPAQLSLLQSGDAAQLRAAGFPEDTIRLITVGRAFATMRTRMQSLRPTPTAEGEYWKNTPSFFQSRTKEQRAESMKVQREFNEALRAAFGDDNDPWGNQSRLAFLPAAKREQLRQIEQDYSEMQSDIYSEINGVQLSSDREKIKLLEQEKLRDIAATLSPEELEQYNLRVSRTAGTVRNRYGDAIQSEADYRKIFALQKAFDDQYPEYRGPGGMNSDTARARWEADRVLQDQIRAAIGEEKYAAFQKANDPSYKTLTSLVKRLDLPATTIDAVHASRDTFAVQSQQIAQNGNLSVDQRRDQLKALGSKAQTALESSLGKEGAAAYAQRAEWLQMLKSGVGFSADRQAAPAQLRNGNRSFYPVIPGAPASPATPPKT